jgi:hypothetical protein
MKSKLPVIAAIAVLLVLLTGCSTPSNRYYVKYEVSINGMENGETHVTVNTENGEQSFVTPREFSETFGPVKRNFVAKISAYNTVPYSAAITVRIYACKGEEAFVLKASKTVTNGTAEAEYRIDF